MNKKSLAMLEKVFDAEISGRVFPSKSKIAKQLESDGYIVYLEKLVLRDRFGDVFARGYVTTTKGNYTYCKSCEKYGYDC